MPRVVGALKPRDLPEFKYAEKQRRGVFRSGDDTWCERQVD